MFKVVRLTLLHKVEMPLEARRGCQSGIGVTDGCELPYEFWELNSGPLDE